MHKLVAVAVCLAMILALSPALSGAAGEGYTIQQDGAYSATTEAGLRSALSLAGEGGSISINAGLRLTGDIEFAGDVDVHMGEYALNLNGHRLTIGEGARFFCNGSSVSNGTIIDNGYLFTYYCLMGASVSVEENGEYDRQLRLDLAGTESKAYDRSGTGWAASGTDSSGKAYFYSFRAEGENTEVAHQTLAFTEKLEDDRSYANIIVRPKSGAQTETFLLSGAFSAKENLYLYNCNINLSGDCAFNYARFTGGEISMLSDCTLNIPSGGALELLGGAELSAVSGSRIVNAGAIAVGEDCRLSAAEGVYSGAGKVYGPAERISGITPSKQYLDENGNVIANAAYSEEALRSLAASATAEEEIYIVESFAISGAEPIIAKARMILLEGVALNISTGASLTIEEAALCVENGSLTIEEGGAVSAWNIWVGPGGSFSLARAGDVSLQGDSRVWAELLGEGGAKLSIPADFDGETWYREDYVDSEEGLSLALANSAAPEGIGGAEYSYGCYILVDIALSEDLTLMDGCELFVDAAFSVPEGVTLTIAGEGYLYVRAPMSVKGSIVNNGYMSVEANEGASLELLPGGSYSGEGRKVFLGEVIGIEWLSLKCLAGNAAGFEMIDVDWYSHDATAALDAGSGLRYSVTDGAGNALSGAVIEAFVNAGRGVSIASVEGNIVELSIPGGIADAELIIQAFAQNGELLGETYLSLSANSKKGLRVQPEGSGSAIGNGGVYNEITAGDTATNKTFTILRDGAPITDGGVRVSCDNPDFAIEYDTNDCSRFTVKSDMMRFDEMLSVALTMKDETQETIEFGWIKRPETPFPTMDVDGKAAPIGFYIPDGGEGLREYIDIAYSGAAVLPIAEVYADTGEGFVKVEGQEGVRTVTYSLLGADESGVTLSLERQLTIPDGITEDQRFNVLASVDLGNGAFLAVPCKMSILCGEKENYGVAEGGSIQEYLNELVPAAQGDHSEIELLGAEYEENLIVSKPVSIIGAAGGTKLCGSIRSVGEYLSLHIDLEAPDASTEYGVLADSGGFVSCGAGAISGFGTGLLSRNGHGRIYCEGTRFSDNSTAVQMSVAGSINNASFSGNGRGILSTAKAGTVLVRDCSFTGLGELGIVAENRSNGKLDIRYNYIEVPKGRTLHSLFLGKNIDYSVLYADEGMKTLRLAMPQGEDSASCTLDVALPIGRATFEDFGASGARTLEVSVLPEEEGGVAATWSFEKAGLAAPCDVSLGVSQEAGEAGKAAISESGIEGAYQVLSFAHDGALPGAARVTVPASEAALSAEGELYLYLINTGAAEGERKLLLKPNRVSIDKEKKTLTVEGITGCSEYLVSADVVDPKYGDVNGDGRIGLADAISVCKLIASAKTPAQLILADVDGDDEVTVRDVIYICRYAIGQITADDFPAEIEESKWGEFVL